MSRFVLRFFALLSCCMFSLAAPAVAGGLVLDGVVGSRHVAGAVRVVIPVARPGRGHRGRAGGHGPVVVLPGDRLGGFYVSGRYFVPGPAGQALPDYRYNRNFQRPQAGRYWR